MQLPTAVPRECNATCMLYASSVQAVGSCKLPLPGAEKVGRSWYRPQAAIYLPEVALQLAQLRVSKRPGLRSCQFCQKSALLSAGTLLTTASKAPLTLSFCGHSDNTDRCLTLSEALNQAAALVPQQKHVVRHEGAPSVACLAQRSDPWELCSCGFTVLVAPETGCQVVDC